MKTVSEIIAEKKINLLGHCIRASTDDPIRQPFLKHDSTMYSNEINRRIGHPRKKWHKEVFEMTWQKIGNQHGNERFDYKNPSHQQKIIDYFQNREEQQYH